LEEYYDNSKKKKKKKEEEEERERERERDIRNHMVGGAGGAGEARSRWNMYIREEKESQRSKSQ